MIVNSLSFLILTLQLACSVSAAKTNRAWRIMDTRCTQRKEQTRECILYLINNRRYALDETCKNNVAKSCKMVVSQSPHSARCMGPLHTCSRRKSRSAASGEAEGNSRWSAGASPQGRASSIVAANGDAMASTSCCDGCPAHMQQASRGRN